MTRQEVLRLSEVAVARGGTTVVQDLTFSVSAGEIVALMGPSGTGKTSVLRVIAGLDACVAGSVVVEAQPVDQVGRPGRTRSRVGLVFQFHNLFGNLTALDNVTLAPKHVDGVRAEDAEARAHALLASLGVAHRAGAFPHELSGGEAQRVAIARALAMSPAMLLLDEPTASLDADRRDELATLVTALASDGRAIVMATHDDAFAQACAARIIRLEPRRAFVSDRRGRL